MVDVGAAHGLRLHDEGSLRVVHGILSAAHALARPLATLLPAALGGAAAESYL